MCQTQILLQQKLRLLEDATSRIANPIELVQFAVATGTANKLGPMGEALFQYDVRGNATRMQRNANVERCLKVVQVAPEVDDILQPKSPDAIHCELLGFFLVLQQIDGALGKQERQQYAEVAGSRTKVDYDVAGFGQGDYLVGQTFELVRLAVDALRRELTTCWRKIQISS